MTLHQGSNFETNKLINMMKNALGHIIVVRITRRGEKMTRSVNIYDHREGETGERTTSRIYWQRIIRQGGGDTVLAGDFNTHSQHWDPRFMERRDATYS